MTRAESFLSKVIPLMLVAITIGFGYTIIDNILIGQYRWHLDQPQTIEGGLTLAVLFVLMAAAALLTKNTLTGSLTILVAAGLYLKLNLVLFPVVLSWLFLETLVAIGRKVYRLMKRSSRDSIGDLLVGISCWSLLVMLLSAVHLGSIPNIKIMTATLMILLLIKPEWKQTLIYKLCTAFHGKDGYEKLGMLFLLIILLMQFAKSNTAIDYDSVWYGLRPELVFDSGSSVFDSQRLLAFVHYYPKLFELLTLPLSGWGDYSFIYSLDTFFLFLLVVSVYRLLGTLNLAGRGRMLVTCLAASIPAVSNMGSTAKPDILVSLFIVIGFDYTLRWLEERRMTDLSAAFSAALLALSTKQISFQYIAILFISFLGYVIIMRLWEFRQDREDMSMSAGESVQPGKSRIISDLLPLGAAATVFILLAWRTLRLTGVPFYPIFGGVWSAMGFRLHYPFVGGVDQLASRNRNFTESITHLYHLLFDPKVYSHYVMVWPGNIALLMFVLLVVFLMLPTANRSFGQLRPFWILMPTFAVTMYFIIRFPEGGDGNYYIIPVILFIATSAPFILTRMNQLRIKKWLYASFVIFIGLHSVLMMVSHWSWATGTSVFESRNLTASEFETKSSNEELFRRVGAAKIEEYIEQRGSGANCIGIGDETVLHRLSCRYEDLKIINAQGYSYILESKAELEKYLKWAQVSYIILPTSGFEGFGAFQEVAEQLRQNPDNVLVPDKGYLLLDINPSSDNLSSIGSNMDTGLLTNGWYDKEGNNRWIAQEAAGVFSSGPQGKLRIEGMVPDIYNTIELVLYHKDREILRQTLEPGGFQLEVELPKQSICSIRIVLSHSYIPSELGVNGDQRRLGVLISKFVLS